jgi:hypothetical protein
LSGTCTASLAFFEMLPYTPANMMFSYSHSQAFLTEAARVASVLSCPTGFDPKLRTANAPVLAGRHAR